MRRAAITAAVLTLLVLSLTVLVLGRDARAARPAVAQVGICGNRDPASSEYADIDGPWVGHGRELSIEACGGGVVAWRVYEACRPGQRTRCDPVVNDIIQYGALMAFLLEGRAGEASVGWWTVGNAHDLVPERLVLRRWTWNVIEVEGFAAFCRPWACDTSVCGA